MGGIPMDSYSKYGINARARLAHEGLSKFPPKAALLSLQTSDSRLQTPRK